MERLLDLLQQAGWLLTPLVLLAAFIIAVTIERLSALGREPRDPLPVLQRLHQAAAEGGKPAVLADAEALGGGVAEVVRAVADARGDDELQLADSLAGLHRRLDGPLPWLRLASELSPLVGCLFCLFSLTTVNRLVIGSHQPELQLVFDRALTLSAGGMLVGLAGWLIAFALDRRRQRVEETLQKVAREVRGLLAGQGPSL